MNKFTAGEWAIRERHDKPGRYPDGSSRSRVMYDVCAPGNPAVNWSPELAPVATLVAEVAEENGLANATLIREAKNLARALEAAKVALANLIPHAKGANGDAAYTAVREAILARDDAAAVLVNIGEG